MAYNTKWYRDDSERSRVEAERRAGKSPLGYLYRLTDISYASVDEYGDCGASYTVIELEALPIRKVTPCGWTLEQYSGARHRWVSKETARRYALPSVSEALTSFLARKKREAAIYDGRAAKARHAASLAVPSLMRIPA